jgi:hypothetical protein
MLYPLGLFKLFNCRNNGVMSSPSPSSHDGLLLLFKVSDATKPLLQSLPFLETVFNGFVRLVSTASKSLYAVMQVPKTFYQARPRQRDAIEVDANFMIGHEKKKDKLEEFKLWL